LQLFGADNRVILVPSKPDRIGFWFYELVVELLDGSTYLVHFKLQEGDKSLGIGNPVFTVVRDWGNVILRHRERNPNPNSILIFDNYYLSKASAQVLDDMGVKYIAGAKANNFNELVAKVGPRVVQKGEWAGVYEPNSHHLFVHKWDRDDHVGKKYVLANCFQKCPKVRGLSYTVPAYDAYKIGFSLCDSFNRHLHDKKWPHRSGGGTKPAGDGHQHKFAMASILQNTFNLFYNVSNVDAAGHSFQSNCSELANQVYEYAISL
jgi:hypothetical protein